MYRCTGLCGLGCTPARGVFSNAKGRTGLILVPHHGMEVNTRRSQLFWPCLAFGGDGQSRESLTLCEGCPPSERAQHAADIGGLRQAPGVSREKCRQPVALDRPGLAIDLPYLHSLTRGLDRDRDAVLAALTLPCGNGSTVAVNTRTKRIARQMHGRAGFSPLQHRIILG